MHRGPVLSTPIGAYGLDLIDEKEVMLFENSADFERKVNSLEDNDTYNEITKNALHVVKSRFNKDIFEKSFDDLMREVW